jgi:hypothetical protein
MATRANIYIDQGTDFVIDLDLFTDQGEDFPISSYSFTGDAKKVYSSSKVFSFSTRLVVSDANKLEISLSANTSANVDPGKYQYDIIMTSNTNSKSKILEGLVFILPTMTEANS